MNMSEQENTDRNLRLLAKVATIMDPMEDYDKLWLISQLIFNLFMEKGAPREEFGNEMRRLGEVIAGIFESNQNKTNILLVHKDNGDVKFGMN